MEPLTQIIVRHEFARKAAISRELEDRLADEKRIRDKKKEDQERQGIEQETDLLTAVHMVLASDEQIEAFTVKLDEYDAATVEALMANEQDLQAVRERIQTMLLEAHTLPDGRRVFKTRDGMQVFDEFGQEIKAEELRPDQISDDKEKWEDYLGAKDEEVRLAEERKELIEFQEKLDDARERLDDPKLTEQELEALDKELGEAMPDRVKTVLGHDAGEPRQERDRTTEQDRRPDPTPASAQLVPAGP